MPTIKAIIEAKFLSVCTASEAVGWLKEKRQGMKKLNSLARDDYSYEEATLAARNDPYIDFGLARYGTSDNGCKDVYQRGDDAIKATFLASFPNGGFAIIPNEFELGDEPPRTVAELCALVNNPSLSDELFRQCFQRTKLFEHLNEEDFQSVLVTAADNPRLMTPYDDTFMDGYRDYSYHSVFSSAWKLTQTMPNTMRWASVLYHLLYRCQPPVRFDVVPVLARWYFKPEKDDDQRNIGFYLRSRLADLLKADDALLRSQDPALRESFYKRFQPRQYPQWPKFAQADTEYFLDSAVHNNNLWVSRELREVLSQLCWAHPDPNSSMEMPNRYNGMEARMRVEYPRWFEDEG
jgi:hypothetical protein